MNLKIGVASLTAGATILANLIFFLATGGYSIGSNVAKIEARLEFLSNDLKKRDEFVNYRIDHLQTEIEKLKGGQK